MKFQVFENLIHSDKDSRIAPEFVRIQSQDLDSMIKFLEEEIMKQAVLIYCTAEESAKIFDKFSDAIKVDETVDPSTLRRLDDSIEGKYKLLVADSPTIALRGLDYRAYDRGLLFVMTRPLKQSPGNDLSCK